jgi:16S rRNA (uracil1498-N3)-methyltransferase
VVREQRRLLIAPSRLEAAAAGMLSLSPDESRYLTRVLRFGPGDGFAVIDGQGSLWQAQLHDADHAQLLQSLAQPALQQPAPQPALVLAVAVVKRDFELVVRMAVELGVDRLIPLLCERTVVLGQLKPERWRSIAAEAAEQCERLWLPCIDDPQPLQEVLADPAASTALRLWATTRQPQLPQLADLLPDQALDPASAAVWLACGPEGGWSAVEEQQAQVAGWQPLQLGPRILRSSTAAVAAMAGLAQWRWGQTRC